MFKKLLVFLLVMAFVPVVFAGTTGKIAGIIKDKQTGEPLPGVNVEVIGTTLGASTDIDGYYVIVNVPVGVQELRVSYIGYKEVLIYNVRVVSDATSRYDFDMEQTLLEVSEVIEVIAQRELIAKDNTSSRSVISSEVINSQPVDNITQTIGLNAGVTDVDPLGAFNNGISVRGSRPGNGEVKFQVDGVDVSNPIAWVNRGYFPGQGNADLATDIPEAGLEEVQVVTGGIGAQYDAKSAIVSMVTKSGGSNYSGQARMSMTPGEYGFGYDFAQPTGYLTDKEAFAMAQRMGTGARTNNDGVGDDAYLALADEDGYIGDDPKSFVNPRFRRYQFSFGGPISVKGMGIGGGMSFNLNADIFDRGGFYRGQKVDSETFTGKLVYNTATNKTYTISYLNSHRKSSLYSTFYSRIVTTGDTLWANNPGSPEATPIVIGSIVDPDGGLHAVENYDMLNNQTKPEEWSSVLSFSYKNTVSSKTFYEFKVNRFQTRQERRCYDPYTGNALGLDDFKESRFNNPANSDYFADPNTPTATRLESYYWVLPMNVVRGRQDDDQVVWTFGADLTSQLNEFNELRMGAEYKTYDLLMDYESWASGGNGYSTFFHVQPRKFNAYIEDKIETDGMIINAGIRFDYFDPNGVIPENFDDPLLADAKDPSTDLYQDPSADWEDRLKNPTKTNTITTLLPRIGISFPITERDVFHINYGHYSGIPAFGYLYDNYNWTLLGAFKYLGNPNLKNEKIISYEAGIEHGFSDDVKLAVTGFYKDIADLINKQKYVDAETGVPYWVNINSDFAAIKGFELALATRRIYNVIAQVAYTYQIARGKNSDSEQGFLDNYYNRQPRTDDFFLDWDVRHTMTANLDYRVPQNWMDSKWLGDWGINMIFTYNSGRPYSSATNVPPPALPPVNDERYPERYNIDMRMFKNFPVWESVTFGAFLEIYNLTNQRNLLTIYNVEQYYLGADEGDGTWNRPDVWSTPRAMRLGFELRF
jgi:outer membrane receptor protein involved in Fe transport